MAKHVALSLAERKVGKFVQSLVDRAVKENRPKARRVAMQLIRQKGELSLRAMLDEVIAEHAKEGALFGAISGAVTSLPGFNVALTTLGLVPEVGYMCYAHCTLIVYLAHVYNPKMSLRRLNLLVGLALIGSIGGETGRALLRTAVTKGLTTSVQKLLPRVVLQTANIVLRAIGLRLTRRGLVRVIPVVGAVANAAACYTELRLAGRAYCKLLDAFDSPIASDCPWCDTSLELTEGWGRYVCPSCGKPLVVVP